MEDEKRYYVGEKVLVHEGGFYRSERICKVEKITKTGLILVNGTYYYPDGRQRGGDTWNRSWIDHATEEDIDRVKKACTISKAKSLMSSCKNITYEQAVKIIDVLEE